MLLFKPKSRRVRLMTIPVSLITPAQYQPRREFDAGELDSLTQSIRKNGLLQPVAVRRLADGSFELIAGERRLRAAQSAGMTEIPCIVHAADERRAAVLGLLENMQRQDLTPFEEAEGIRRLMVEWNMTQSEVSARLGKAQSTVANKLRLLRLTAIERERIEAARLTERHARALLRLDSEHERLEALDYIIANQLTVADSELYVGRLLSEEGPRRAMRMQSVKDYRIYVNTLSKAVDTLRRSGVDARSKQVENDEYITYTVTIAKKCQQLSLFK